MKDKHPEYFARLNSLKHDLRKKRKDIQELESQTKAMEDFSSNNEYHFIKNLTPRLFAVDPSYKTNKAKLMRDVRLLRSALDGKIPPAQTNDPEQLKILLAKCRKSVQEFPDAPNFFEGETSAEGECSLKNSPVKSNFTKHEVKVAAVCDEKVSHCFPRGGSKDISDSSSSSDSDDYRRKKRKRKNIRRQKREEDIVLLKHVPVLTVEKIRAPLEAAVIFVNKQIHFIIQDIRFLLMEVPLLMPVTLLSCMACTFKTHNLFVVISRICIIRHFQFLCLFTFQMFMVYSRGKLPLQITQCQLLKGFLAPKMKRSKIKMSGVI